MNPGVIRTLDMGTWDIWGEKANETSILKAMSMLETGFGKVPIWSVSMPVMKGRGVRRLALSGLGGAIWMFARSCECMAWKGERRVVGDGIE
jgi:hypothetical protein